MGDPVSAAPIPAPIKRSRRSYLGALAALVAPLWLLCLYTLSVISPSARWGTSIVFLLSGSVSSLCGWLILREWEEKIRHAFCQRDEEFAQSRVPIEEVDKLHQKMEAARLGYEHQLDLMHASVLKNKQLVEELEEEIAKKTEHLRVAYLEFSDLRKEYQNLQEEYLRYRKDCQTEVEQKEAWIAEYQQTIVDQRGVIEKKQDYISRLEGKVRDLMYQIRNLLQIEDAPNQAQAYIPNVEKGRPYDLSQQVGQVIEMAEHLKGMDHLGGRYLTQQSSPCTLDLRPLFDRLAQEEQRIFFVYSPEEDQLLFLHERVRDRLGWPAEKIIKDFGKICSIGTGEWRRALTTIQEGKPAVFPLVCRHRLGHEVRLDVYAGKVCHGPLSSLVIGMWV